MRYTLSVPNYTNHTPSCTYSLRYPSDWSYCTLFLVGFCIYRSLLLITILPPTLQFDDGICMRWFVFLHHVYSFLLTVSRSNSVGRRAQSGTNERKKREKEYCIKRGTNDLFLFLCNTNQWRSKAQREDTWEKRKVREKRHKLKRNQGKVRFLVRRSKSWLEFWWRLRWEEEGKGTNYKSYIEIVPIVCVRIEYTE